MPIDSGNLALKGLDDLFSTEEKRQEEQREQVQQIPIDALHPFTNHPFKVLDDEAMTRTVESIAQYGVLAPLIARPRPDGDGYEIISGHRRQYAAKLAGLDTLPVIVRQMSDDAAVILMVDSNLQREHILPSERAFAYKMKLDAMRRTSGRPSKENPRQLVGNFETADVVGKESGESGRQVQRFIRLTNLIPELLDMVDEKKISFNPAVELSYLDESQQRDFLEAMEDTQNAPSLSQAQQLKKMAQQGEFSYEKAFDVMGQEKKSEKDTVTIKNETLRKYFSPQLHAKADGGEDHPAFGCVAEKTAASQRTLTRNARPDGVFFVCKNLEVTPMNNTIDFKTAFFSIMHMAMKNELGSAEPYFAATSPVLDLTVIRPDDAPHILACFDEADEGIGISENEPLGFRYNPKQVVKLMGQRYLVGPVIFHRFDEDGNFASLTMGDMYTIQKYLESKSVTLMIDRDKLTCICID